MLSEHPILVIFVAAVIASLIAQTRAGSRVPVVVFEVVFGIVVVPVSWRLIEYGTFLSAMHTVGVVAELFMPARRSTSRRSTRCS